MSRHSVTTIKVSKNSINAGRKLERALLLQHPTDLFKLFLQSLWFKLPFINNVVIVIHWSKSRAIAALPTQLEAFIRTTSKAADNLAKKFS